MRATPARRALLIAVVVFFAITETIAVVGSHRFATDAINRGVPIETVSKLIGHFNSKATAKDYAQISGATMKNEWFDAMGWSS